MAKASDNAFPKVIVVEGTAPASPAAGSQKLFIDSADHKLKRKDSSGVVTTVEGGGGSGAGGVLAYTTYVAAASYTTASGTPSQIDATHLTVTFTAPSSGKVIVDLTGLVGIGTGTGGQWYEWSLFESGVLITGTDRQVIQGGAASLIEQMTSRHIITGLTPGSSHTYTWGHRAVSCTATLYAAANPVSMLVAALP